MGAHLSRLRRSIGALMMCAPGILFAGSAAHATSSINTALPAQGQPYNAAPIRQNFQAAATDISALQNMNAGATAPANPVLGTLWLDTPTGQTTYILNIWNDRQSKWLPIAYFDSLNNLWMTNVGGGLPTTLAASDTTDLGSVPQAVVTISGAGPIYSFGSSAPAGVIKFLAFNGVTTLVDNATSMQLPGGQDITTAAGDLAIATALGSGNWQVMYYTSAALSVPRGGTGQSSLTAHAVVLGEGASPVGLVAPGTTGYPFISAGSGADPLYGQLDLTVGVKNSLPVANGGIGLATVPTHDLLIGNGTTPMTTLAPGSAGLPLVSQGSTIDPAYAVLGVPGGGTGQVTLGQYQVLLGNGTGPISGTSPGTAGYPLLSTGPSSFPSFGQLDLAGAGVTGQISLTTQVSGVLPTANGGTGGTLPVANGGSGATTLAAHSVVVGEGTSPVATAGPGTAGYPLVSGGASADPSYQQLNLAGAGVTGQINLASQVTGTLSASNLPTPLPLAQIPSLPLHYGFYTTSGTFTIPATNIVAILVGGGGGGGNGTANASTPAGGGGGGSGAIVIYPLTGLTVGNTLTFTVGAGGTAGAWGGDTTIASGTQTIVSATAGGGGPGASSEPGPNNGGTGGTPAGGILGQSINLYGATGQPGFNAGTTGVPGAGGTLSGSEGTIGFGGSGGSASTGAGSTGSTGQIGMIFVMWSP